MFQTLKTALFAAMLLASGVMMSGCTPWIEAKMSQTERALNCAAISMSASGVSTRQADACASHPAAS